MSAPHPSPLRDRLAAGLRIALAAAMLMWPTWVARRPTVFFDTGQYWWRGRMIVVDGLGLDRGAPTPFHQSVGAMPPVHGIVQTPASIATFIGARSVTYSLFVFLTQQLGTLWLTATIEALATAVVFYAVWRAATPRAAAWTYLAMMAALSAFTSLAFFASFSMPDVFAGLGVLIAVALTLYWDRLGAGTRLGLWSLLALALSFHSSHLLLGLLFLPVALFALWRLGASRRTMMLRGGALAAAVVAAGLSGVLADGGARALTGVDAHNPPFLTARLLADGPGRTYLRQACASAQPYFLCHFETLPLDSTEDVLWSDHADTGVFMISDVPDRLKLEAEQGRFALGAVLADPLGAALASLRNAAEQINLFAVDEPLRDPCGMRKSWSWSRDFLGVLVVDLDRCGARQGRLIPPAPLYLLHGLALIASVFGLWRLGRGRWGAKPDPARGPDGQDDIGRLLAATGLVAAAIVLNAVVCGALSGPFPRYEARLIWLIPTLALMAGCTIAAPALARARTSLTVTPSSKSAMGDPAT